MLRRKLYVISTIVVLSILAILVAYTNTRVSRNSIEERYQKCIDIYLGLMNYTTLYDCWVPAYSVDKNNSRCLSWRYLICSLISTPNPEFDIHQSWDSIENITRYNQYRKLHLTYGYEYFNFCNTKASSFFDETSNIYAINCPDAAFDKYNKNDWKNFPDNLILFIEINERKIHWLAPIDYEEIVASHYKDPLEFGTDKQGFFIVFYDGTVYYMVKDTPCEVIQQFFTIKKARISNRKTLEPYILRKFERSSSL